MMQHLQHHILLLACSCIIVAAGCCMTVNAVDAEPQRHLLSVRPFRVGGEHAANLPQNTMWHHVGDAPSDATMVVTLALARSNLETLYTFANAVSNPTSPQYTQYNTTHELAQATAPSAEAVAAVSSWLSSHDVVHSMQPVTQAVTAHMTVAKAQSLFGPTKFHELQCRSSECGLGTTAIVGDSVSVPQSIRQHLEAVFGIHGLPLPASGSRTMQQPTATAPSVKPVLVTPSVIRHVYNVSGVTPSGSLTNRQAVAEFVGQLVSQTDLTQFFAKYVPDAPPGADKIYKFVNDTQQGQGGEANLDIQVPCCAAQPLQVAPPHSYMRAALPCCSTSWE